MIDIYIELGGILILFNTGEVVVSAEILKRGVADCEQINRLYIRS